MFGIGFTELILISIIAILFLGPDKLPQAMIDIAKFIKSIKKTVSDAKSSLEEEMKIADLKEEALNYKKQLNNATNELKNFKNLSLDDFDDDVTYDEEISTKDASELVPKAHSYESDKPIPAASEDEAVVTPIEKKQDEKVVLKKKPQKTKVAKKNSKKETNTKMTDDTPKDNA